MSQARLAEAIGVSGSYLNLIEHNKRRMPADLLFKVAAVLKVDLREFAVDESAQLHSDVMAAMGEPLFDELELKAVDVRDVIDQHPSFARALVLLYRRFQGAQEALRSLPGLVHGDVAEGLDTSRLPSEEVNDLVGRWNNHFPAIESVVDRLWQQYRLKLSTLFDGLSRILDQELGIEVEVVRARNAGHVVRRYDHSRRLLRLSETLPPRSRHFQMARQIALLQLSDVFDEVANDPELTTEASRRLCRMVLANYFAGAMLMPYEQFLTAAEDLRYDIELLGHRFRTSFEQVAHRLTTLRREGMEGVPFHFVKTDTAGNISKRFSGSGITFARFSGGCPLWNVNTAFRTSTPPSCTRAGSVDRCPRCPTAASTSASPGRCASATGGITPPRVSTPSAWAARPSTRTGWCTPTASTSRRRRSCASVPTAGCATGSIAPTGRSRA